MSLPYSFTYLTKASPRNIKRRLFRDIFFILLLTSSAILTLGIIQGRSIENDISSQLISESALLIKNRFQSTFLPIEHNLQLIARWGQAGIIDFSHPEDTIALLSPLLDIHKELEAITLVNPDNQEILLYKQNNGHQVKISEGNKTPKSSSFFLKNAISQPPSNPIYWSNLYIHPELKEKAITASISWNNPEGKPVGGALFTITINGLLRMIEDIQLNEMIEIVLVNREGLSFSKFESQNRATGNNKNTVHYQTARSYAIKKWISKENQYLAPLYFHLDGNAWWAGFSPLRSQLDLNWIGIILPESIIREDVQNKWITLGTIAVCFLLSGFLLSALLVRKYSHQLKDLPLQSIKHDTFINDLLALIKAGESNTVEFKSTIRTNLQTGKAGKEIEIAWLKAVCSFMNSDGGVLIIGVKDDGEILGLEMDKFTNPDKCLLHCKNLISSHIGAEFSQYIQVKYGTIENHSIIAIECERVRKPVFLKIGKSEDFLIRSGPSNIKLTMSQMVKYLNER